jgi:hypothetical protein
MEPKIPPKVFVATPYCDASMSIDLCKFYMIQALQNNIVYNPFIEGRPHDAARNTIVHEYKNNREDYTHVLMIDSDCSPPDNILELAKLDMDVVGPIIFSYQEGHPFALILKAVPEGYQQIKKVPPNTLMEVDATGTGCLMVARRVFERIPPPWFRFSYTEGGLLKSGEDFNFCKLVKSHGFKIHVHTGFMASHYATVDLRKINDLLCQVRLDSLKEGKESGIPQLERLGVQG